MGHPKQKGMLKLQSMIQITILSFQPFDSGEKILFIYFDRFPHNQDKFQAFRNTPILLLKGTPGFRHVLSSFEVASQNKILGCFLQSTRIKNYECTQQYS